MTWPEAFALVGINLVMFGFLTILVWRMWKL